jgi:hypothetical protein
MQQILLLFAKEEGITINNTFRDIEVGGLLTGHNAT